MLEPLVLLPLRAPGSGLTRLAAVLDADERARLASAMLADVVAALRAAGLEKLVAVTAGVAAAEAAEALDLEVHPEDESDRAGLDGALAGALAARPAAGAAAVVMPDLPRLTAEDVTGLLRPVTPVVVAPTADGGTGALLRRPPGVIPTAYGPRSGTRHRRLARDAGVDVAVVHSPGFAHDLDTVSDLRALVGARVGAHTATVVDDVAGVAGAGR